jgi:hypothetical protein
VSARESIVRSRPYVLPRPYVSEDEYERFHHLDLAGLSSLQMWAEHYEASRALAALVRSRRDPVIVHGAGWTLSASWWLRERVQRTQGGRP